jgi:hypothetical protein
MRSQTYGDKQREEQQRKKQEELLKKKSNPEGSPTEAPKADAEKPKKKDKPGRRSA